MKTEEKIKKVGLLILSILLISFFTMWIVYVLIEIKKENYLLNQMNEITSLRFEIDSDNEFIAERAGKRIDSLHTVLLNEYLQDKSSDRYRKFRLLEDIKHIQRHSRFKTEYKGFNN